jgi:hypothetical protein
MDVSASPHPPSIQGPTPAPESDLYSRTSSLSSRTLPLASHDRPSSSADKPIYPSGDLEKQQLASELNPALHQLPFSTTAPTKAAESDPFLVSASHPTYVPPTAIPVWRKWLAVLAIASGSFCVYVPSWPRPIYFALPLAWLTSSPYASCTVRVRRVWVLQHTTV